MYISISNCAIFAMNMGWGILGALTRKPTIKHLSVMGVFPFVVRRHRLSRALSPFLFNVNDYFFCFVLKFYGKNNERKWTHSHTYTHAHTCTHTHTHTPNVYTRSAHTHTQTDIHTHTQQLLGKQNGVTKQCHFREKLESLHV